MPIMGLNEEAGEGSKLYEGKVDCSNIDKRRIKKFAEDQYVLYYSGIVYSIALKQLIRIAYVQDKRTKRYDIFLCTTMRPIPEKLVEKTVMPSNALRTASLYDLPD